MTDGYQVYHSIAEEREYLTIAGCWPHARRGFADVVKAAGKKDLNIRESIAYKSLQLIQTMSRYEEEFSKREFCVPEIKRRQRCTETRHGKSYQLLSEPGSIPESLSNGWICTDDQ